MTSHPLPLQGPSPNAHTARFLAGADRREFLLNHCRACGKWNAPEASRCVSCASPDLVAEPASLAGTLVSWTVLHRKAPSGGTEVSGVLGLVELAEGPWWWAAVDADASDLVEGAAVHVDFVAAAGTSQKVPVFRLDPA